MGFLGEFGGFGIVTDGRKVRGGLFRCGVIRAADCHRHVGLTGAEPNLADEHVLNFNLASVLAGDGKGARLGRGFERIELERPLAVSARSCGLRLTCKEDGHRFARIGPAPDGDGLLALQDHVVREQRR